MKANQKKLLHQIKVNTSDERECVDSFVEVTKAHGRKEIRETFVYKDLSGISSEWVGLCRLIRVERSVCRKNVQRHETSYYISDLKRNRASFFGKHIRNHWGIENRLHWPKDAIMKEDDSRITKGSAPENISIIRNIACNVYRINGFDSLKYAIELYANNIKELFRLIACKKTKYKRT